MHSSSPSWKSSIPYIRVIILGLVSAGFWWQLLTLGDLRSVTGLFVFIFSVLFFLYLGAIWKSSYSTPVIIVGLVFAVLFRGIMFLSTPTQSNDIYRYVWDGHVMHHGINPYDYPPSAPELRELQKSPLYSEVGFLNLNTIYPPLAQMVFYVGYLISPEEVWGMKLLIILFDLGIIGLLLWILRMLHKPLGYILIYAWHPLIIFEYASSGHNDAIMMFFVVLACALLIKGKSLLSWSSLGLAIASKISPVFLVPWIWKHMRWWTIILLPFIIILPILPFISAGDHIVLEGMKQYGGHHEFNSSLYLLFSLVFPENEYVRTIMSIAYVLLVLLLSLSIKKHTRERFFLMIIWIFGAYFLLGTNVHPWYLTWIIPFFCIVISPTWMFFSWIVIFSYFHYQSFGHAPNHIATLIQYIPLYMLVFGEIGYQFALHKEYMHSSMTLAQNKISKAFQFQRNIP